MERFLTCFAQGLACDERELLRVIERRITGMNKVPFEGSIPVTTTYKDELKPTIPSLTERAQGCIPVAFRMPEAILSAPAGHRKLGSPFSNDRVAVH